MVLLNAWAGLQIEFCTISETFCEALYACICIVLWK